MAVLVHGVLKSFLVVLIIRFASYLVVVVFITDYIVSGTFSTITVVLLYFVWQQEWVIVAISYKKSA